MYLVAFLATVMASFSLIRALCVGLQPLGGAALRFPRTGGTRYSVIRAMTSVDMDSVASQTDLPSWEQRCETEEALCAVGARLSEICGAGDTLLLRGDLGSGKTTLTRSLVQSFFGAPDLRVTSPSYLLANEYASEECSVHHLDLYRLPTGGDVSFLGVPAIFEDCLCLVEWPQRLRQQDRPARYLDVEILVDATDGALSEEEQSQGRVVRLSPSAVATTHWTALLDDAGFPRSKAAVAHKRPILE